MALEKESPLPWWHYACTTYTQKLPACHPPHGGRWLEGCSESQRVGRTTPARCREGRTDGSRIHPLAFRPSQPTLRMHRHRVTGAPGSLPSLRSPRTGGSRGVQMETCMRPCGPVRVRSAWNSPEETQGFSEKLLAWQARGLPLVFPVFLESTAALQVCAGARSGLQEARLSV